MRPAFIIVFFLFYGFSFSLFSQETFYEREVVDTLTSKYFSGRGAINQGEKKASEYIAKEYRRHGLKKIENTYFQKFNYPINTFPGELSVALDKTLLVAGKDYLVDASSGKISGIFNLVWYNKDNAPTKKQLKKLAFRNFFANKFIVIDDKGVEKENESFQSLMLNSCGAAGIILIEEGKLTQSISTTYNDYGIVRIKREKISRDYKTLTLTINQKFIRDYQSQNVIGFVEGSEHPDSIIILSAHYDHLGMMGNKVYFPGANDNASGVAMLLRLAHYYTHKEPPLKTLVFIAFGAEEAGLIGSKYFVDNPTVSFDNINFVFNMDLMGTGDNGAMIVNGTIFPKQFEKLQKINKERDYLLEIKKRGKAANSDHYWFTEKGIPSFFMYTLGGIKAYHDVYDVSKTLPLTDFEDCFRLIHNFVDEL
jgi:aminopeptidase YwaD